MPNTYTQIFIQVVFAVRERDSLIGSEWKEELFKYIAGIIKNQGQKLIAIGGVADHIHILLALQPNIALSDLVRDIKTSSSKWINDRHLFEESFTGRRDLELFHTRGRNWMRLQNMLHDQEHRHANRTFREEYSRLLERFDIQYDERYLFDFFD
jgi:putative transposase